MKTTDVFDTDNEILKYLANKDNTSKKWIVHRMIWNYVRDEKDSDLVIIDNQIKIKEE